MSKASSFMVVFRPFDESDLLLSKIMRGQQKRSVKLLLPKHEEMLSQGNIQSTSTDRDVTIRAATDRMLSALARKSIRRGALE